MTDDERQEAERVFEAAISDFLRGIASRDEIERAVDVIDAARVRWQNEAIDKMRDVAKSAVCFGLDESETHKMRAICAPIEAEACALKK